MGSLQLRLSRQIRGSISVCLVLAISFVTPTNPLLAQSSSDQQAANTAISIVVEAADLLGVPIDPNAVPVIQGVVTCALSGSAAGDCAKNMVVNTALSQLGAIDPAVAQVLDPAAIGCLADGKPAVGCLSAAALDKLPPEAKPLVTCVIGGGNIGDCAEKAVLTQVLPELGVSLPPDVQSTLKDVVGCVAGGGKSLANCAGNLVTNEVNQALTSANAPQAVVTSVDAMVSCVAAGGNAGDCAKSAATQNLPPDVRALQSCLSAPGASAQSCIANFAAKNIPDPTSAAVVTCMGAGSGAQVQSCIAKNAASALGTVAQQQAAQTAQAAAQAAAAAVQTAQDAIKNLNINAPLEVPPKFPQSSLILADIMNIAQGIQNRDIGQILAGIGPAGFQVASQIILSIFVTPEIASQLSPVVDAMIQNDVAAIAQLGPVIKRGDAVGAAQVAFDWYATQYIQGTCALMPRGAVSNTLCGDAAKAINAISNAGGDVAKGILGLGKDALQLLGVWNLVDNVATTAWNDVTSVISDVGDLFKGPKHTTVYVCKGWATPSQYFSGTMANCMPNLASAAEAAGHAPDTTSVADACKTYYNCPGFDQKAVAANCQSMASSLGSAAQGASNTLKAAAASYTAAGAAAFVAQVYADPNQRRGDDFCSPGFWSFERQQYAKACSAALAKFFPSYAAAPSSNACPIQTATSALQQACANAIDSSSGKGAFAGPNSSYCQLQQQQRSQAIVSASNATTPCQAGQNKIQPLGAPINLNNDDAIPLMNAVWQVSINKPIGGFGTVTNFSGATVVCEPQTSTVKPPWLQAAGPVLLPFKHVTLPPAIGLLPPFLLPDTGTKTPPKLTPISIRPGAILRPPPVSAPPNNNSAPRPRPATTDNVGHGGIGMVNGNTGNAPSGNGGAARINPMDQLQGQMSGSGIANVTGNAGSAGFGPAASSRINPRIGGLTPSASSPTVPAKGAPKVGVPSTGEGGAYKVNGSTGNAPTVPPRLNSNAPAGRPPVLARPAPAATSMPLDTGACPGCGNNGAFKPPK